MTSVILEANANNTGSGLFGIFGFVLVIAVFYFFFIRPQKKQEREANAMRDALQIGDEVTTIGGIIGRIVSIKDETVVIETSRDRTKIRFLRSAIRNVDVKAEETKEAFDKLERRQAEQSEQAPAEETAPAEEAVETTEDAEAK